ncbi:MAG: RNB domain-containing ribonuclease [Bacteroidales bacterium]|nr:RNB domain-containing ribonuclease [Bacteroidales bacterium]
MYSNSKKKNKGGRGHSSPADRHSSRDKKLKSNIEYEGTVQMNRDGNIFVKIKDQDFDVFVKSTRSKGALNGDTVKVAITKTFFHDMRKEGEIRSIVERSPRPFVGVLHIIGPQAWVLMQSRSMPYDISVPVLDEYGTPLSRRKTMSSTDAKPDYTGALRQTPEGDYAVTGLYESVDGESREMRVNKGMKVAVKVDGWPRGEAYPSGRIVDVLGEMGKNDTEMHAILAEYGLPYRFEPEVENAADSISDEITEKDLKGRKDFRKTLTFTIDPADAKDFDDALSFKPLDNGNFEVGVHIADVSYYVKPGTPVDKEAQARGTSVYLVDRTVPMLPEKLSNKLCSLRPGEDKLTFSAVFEITPKGKVFNQWFGRTIINSDYRFAYETAQQIIDAGEEAYKMDLRGGTDGVGVDSDKAMKDGVLTGCVIPKELKEAILKLWGIASILRQNRFKAGAVSFERPEMKVDVDEDGKPIGVHQHISKEANWLIEEFMLLANRSVAEFIATGGKMDGKARKDAKTFVYRIHDEPNSEKLQNLGSFARNFGYQPKFGQGREVAHQLNSLLDSAREKPEFMPLEMLALRAMAKACYSTENIGHYGLAFNFYTHFTSPIRRYPDTMVHRLLSMYLGGAPSQNKDYYEEQCVHASDREVLAANAERDSIKYKLVEFMEDKVGQEFDGHISGLTQWGIYVEIEPTKIEGMVSLMGIGGDYYEFDEDEYVVRGNYTGKVFRLGDPVRIKVKSTNLEQRLLDYALVTSEPEQEEPRRGDRAERPSRPRAKVPEKSPKKAKSSKSPSPKATKAKKGR